MLRDCVQTTWTTKGEGVIKTPFLNKCYLVKVPILVNFYYTTYYFFVTDSHCECGDDWLRPLLQRIKDEPKSFVVPIIGMMISYNKS